MERETLTPEHVSRLREVQRKLHEILPELDKLDTTDYDTSGLRAANHYASSRITKILQHFSPPEMSG